MEMAGWSRGEERGSTCASAGSADDSATGHDAGRPDATTGHKEHKWHREHGDCRARSRDGDADQARGGGWWQAGISGAAATHDGPYAPSPPEPPPPPREPQPVKRQRVMNPVLRDLGRDDRGWRRQKHLRADSLRQTHPARPAGGGGHDGVLQPRSKWAGRVGDTRQL